VLTKTAETMFAVGCVISVTGILLLLSKPRVITRGSVPPGLLPVSSESGGGVSDHSGDKEPAEDSSSSSVGLLSPAKEAYPGAPALGPTESTPFRFALRGGGGGGAHDRLLRPTASMFVTMTPPLAGLPPLDGLHRPASMFAMPLHPHADEGAEDEADFIRRRASTLTGAFGNALDSLFPAVGAVLQGELSVLPSAARHAQGVAADAAAAESAAAIRAQRLSVDRGAAAVAVDVPVASPRLVGRVSEGGRDTATTSYSEASPMPSARKATSPRAGQARADDLSGSPAGPQRGSARDGARTVAVA
jgi:hypothetical protein